MMDDDKKDLVLVIEDDKAIANVIQEFLELNGYDVVITHDGRSGLELYREHKPLIVIVDINVPQLNGFEFIKLINGDIDITSVIVVTGYGDQENIRIAQRLGAWNVLVKPIDFNLLLVLIKRNFKRAKIIRGMHDTEQLLQHELLHKTSELNSILFHTHDIIYHINPDNNFIFINNAVTKYGYTVDELIGTNIFNLIHSADHYIAQHKVNERRTGDRATKVELRILTKNGDIRYFEYTTSGIYDHTETGAQIFQGTLGIARDITNRKISDEALQLAYAHLSESLDGVLQALVKATELRDPYTFGHMERVSKIAVLIANEMRLLNLLDCVQIAGKLHDIGKLNIPSDILTRPTKLTAIEYEMVKLHSQHGYEILKKIKFPYPIANMVLQHHERLDGTGYPNGLKDDEILLESQIIAVADVVESIVSHRPYRAALGLDYAIRFIEESKGILFRDDVSDAILAIMKNGTLSYIISQKIEDLYTN